MIIVQYIYKHRTGLSYQSSPEYAEAYWSVFISNADEIGQKKHPNLDKIPPLFLSE